MLIFFPRLLPDELFFSVCGRYHRDLDAGNDQRTSRELFGLPIANFGWDFPSRLQAFVDQLPGDPPLTAEKLIEENTMFPLYRPFITEERATRVVSGMVGTTGAHRYNRCLVGMINGKFPLVKYLRCCPDCIAEDERTYRTSYWHRSHQVHGVFVCHKHGSPLLETKVSTLHKTGESLFKPLNKELINKLLFSEKFEKTEYENLKKLSDSICWILNNPIKIIGRKNLCKRYKRFLLDNNLFLRRSRISIAKIMDNIQCVFGEKILKLLCCNFEKNLKYPWISNLFFNNNFGPNPLYHLLLIQSLNLDLKEVFLADYTDETVSFADGFPFGKGPWPCLNPASNHYKKNVVIDCRIERNTGDGRPIAIFTCDCGYAYERIGPDKAKKDRFEKYRVVRYGEVFEDELLRLVEGEGKKHKEVAEILGVHKSYVGNMLKKIKERPSKEEQLKKELAELEQKRNEWSRAIKKNPSLGRTELACKYPGLVSYFYRKDRDWFKNNQPPIKSTSAHTVDWKLRDEQLSSGINDAVANIKGMLPLARASISRIAQLLNSETILKSNRRLNKLPKTKKLLEEASESVDDFQIRRLYFFANELKKNGDLSRFRLLRASGLEYNKCSKRVQEVIDRLLNGG
jgi:ParB-like chromosome segregation protein Spo0J